MQQQSSRTLIFNPAKLKNSEQKQGNTIYLPQKLRIIQDIAEQNECSIQEDENTLTIENLLKNEIPIVFSGAKGFGKTTLARKIEEQITQYFEEKSIKSLFISAKCNIEQVNKRKLEQYFFQQNYENKNTNDILRSVVLIDDFDDILLQDYQFLQSIQNLAGKSKSKFIYFINTSIKEHQVFKKWIEIQNCLALYEIMQLKKRGLKDFFENYLQDYYYILNLDLSLPRNNILVKSTRRIFKIFQLKQQNYRLLQMILNKKQEMLCSS